MISFLSGTNGGMEDDGAMTIVVNGVGYRVVVSDRDRGKINVRGVGAHVDVFCRSRATENEICIFGFLSSLDRHAFDRLIKLDGIGVSAALRLLSVFEAPELAQVVKAAAVQQLLTVPGIGKKTAVKILTVVL